MLKGFREFITRGNVIDLAVAVVIGAAFTALVASFTDNLIKPLIGLVLGGGVTAGAFEINGQVFNITNIVNAIITFLITAAVVYFVFVVPMNKFRERADRKKGPAEPGDEAATELDALRQIRDELRELKASMNPPTGGPGA